METTAATAIAIREKHRRLEVAVHRLLRKLKRFVEVFPMMEGDKLPEHDVVWIEYPDGGPGSAIVDANKSHPDLWRAAIPTDVVIVPREMLARAGLQDDVVEAMERYGSDIVETQAARFLHNQDFQNSKSQ